MEIKHSIIMICYNQEQYIRQALDSVLSEKVKPYEIIIGDDCSKDGTRAILQEYNEKYPEIIKLVLNEKNLGIFANLNNVAPKATGDLIHFLSGDDWYKPNFLENLNKLVVGLDVNSQKSKFLILSHTVIHHIDGSERIERNHNSLAKFTPVGALLRSKLYTRHTGISKSLFEKYPVFPEDSDSIGPWADFIHHTMFMQHCEKLIVMDCEGPVYREGVGIASRTGRVELARSFQRALLRIQSHHVQGELNLNELDAKYLEFLIASAAASLDFSLIAIARLFQSAWRVLKIDSSEIGIVTKELLMAFRRILGQFKRSHFNLKACP